MPRGCLVIALLGGCDLVFSLERPDAGPDAGPDTGCPDLYDVTIAATTSRYRIDDTERTYPVSKAACAADEVGVTHLAALDSPDEAAGLELALSAALVVRAAPRARYRLAVDHRWPAAGRVVDQQSAR